MSHSQFQLRPTISMHKVRNQGIRSQKISQRSHCYCIILIIVIILSVVGQVVLIVELCSILQVIELHTCSSVGILSVTALNCSFIINSGQGPFQLGVTMVVRPHFDLQKNNSLTKYWSFLVSSNQCNPMFFVEKTASKVL